MREIPEFKKVMAAFRQMLHLLVDMQFEIAQSLTTAREKRLERQLNDKNFQTGVDKMIHIVSNLFVMKTSTQITVSLKKAKVLSNHTDRIHHSRFKNDESDEVRSFQRN